MTLQRAALWAIVIASAVYLLVAGRGLLLPFVLGIVLWYMVDALADAFEHPRIGHWRLPRPLAMVAAICVMGGLLWVVGRTIGRNVSAVVAAAPNYESRLQNLINQGAALIGLEQTPTIGELFDRISLADTLSSVATATASIVSVAGIVIIYAGFLFVEQVRFRRKLAIMLGSGMQQARVQAVLDRIDRDIRIYIRIK
ncbi:MAG TPA: AI-2E family transporter, partial [Reyranella sp.]|nr:AI-2E family transporter [Reyranella sp.]